MNARRLRLFACLPLALLWLTPAHAAGERADSAGEQAQQDRRDQEKLYSDGIQAISEGRKNDASALFRRVIEKEPQHAGAYLEIAMIQCDLGHEDEAETLFKIIETRFKPSAGVQEVINMARRNGCAQWQARVQWSMTAGRGYDQNVNQGASNPNFSFGHNDTLTSIQLAPEYLPLSDQYTTLSADYQRDLTQNGVDGFIQFQGRRNDALGKYDTTSLFVGVDKPWRVGNWPLRGTVMAGVLGLGRALYQKQTAVQMRVTPPLHLPDAMELNLTGGISHVHYQTLEGFDSNTADLRAQLSYRSDKLQMQASLGLANDRALGTRPGGDRNGWQAGVVARAPLAGRVLGEFGATYQAWHSASSYSPGLIDQVRDQGTTLLRAALIVPVATNQAIHVELRDVRNKENISIFQYGGRQLQVTWQWLK